MSSGPVVKVALLQMTATSQLADENIPKGDAFCRKAASLGADIAIFPEMWSNGYAGTNVDDPEAVRAWKGHAVSKDSNFVGHFRNVAKELNMAIAVTYFEKTSGAPANSVTLIDRFGRDRFTYTKIHTCDWGPEGLTQPGSDCYVTDLDTKAGLIKVGAMICYDREHPETARMLMLKGAELVLVPNACHLDELRLTQFRVRSYENSMALAMTNYANLNGASIAFNGIPDEGEHKILAVQADNREDVFTGDIDIGHLREWRKTCIWGNRFRRPSRYGLLASQDVVPPFDHPPERR